ncbi:hypothetical protein ACFJI0_09970 [Hydrogenophaga sp. UC242_53]|uniref:RIFT barrel domain-containing protein n=1 Tax=Hydrogenophaga sp. UC242_53 TaxID=3350170 RepID=UPI0036D3E151
MEVSTGTASSALPITFGQPFKAGAVQANQGLVATDSSGASVPLQMDEVTSHRDGSLRFAVLSAKVSNLAANQPKLINLFAGAKSSATQTIPASPDWNLELEAKVYNGSTLVSTLVAQAPGPAQAADRPGLGPPPQRQRAHRVHRGRALQGQRQQRRAPPPLGPAAHPPVRRRRQHPHRHGPGEQLDLQGQPGQPHL